MKYRIIEERDGNGHGHFELEIGEINWRGKEVFVPVLNLCYNIAGEHCVRKFDSKQACLYYLNQSVRTRTICEEGEV